MTDGEEQQKKSNYPNDRETIKHFEREIEFNQRVANGENQMKVLDSKRSDEDKKRLEEAIKAHKAQKMLQRI